MKAVASFPIYGSLERHIRNSNVKADGEEHERLKVCQTSLVPVNL
jgi:hypothetical protein